MRTSPSLLLLLGLALIVSLSGCGVGGDGIRITEGTPRGTDESRTTITGGTAIVVHVNQFERIATIRKGRELGEGFLVAIDRMGNETAVLKTFPKSATERLQTAEILEGNPGINDVVRAASPARSAELEKIYRAPAEETQ